MKTRHHKDIHRLIHSFNIRHFSHKANVRRHPQFIHEAPDLRFQIPLSKQEENALRFLLMNLFKYSDQKDMILLLVKSSHMPHDKLILQTQFLPDRFSNLRIKTKTLCIDPVFDNLYPAFSYSLICKHIRGRFAGTGKEQGRVLLQLRFERFKGSLLDPGAVGVSGVMRMDNPARHTGFSDCHNGDTSTKTDYSEHDLFLGLNGGIGGFDLELQTDFRFYPTSFLTLAPLLSFNAQYLKFSAKNGTGYYGNNNGSKIYPYDDASHRTVYDYDGMSVIDYDVYNFFVWTGLRADFLPCSWAKISLASEVAVFYLMMDYDKHLSNHQDFIDIAYYAFFAFRQTLKSEFKIKTFFFLFNLYG